MPKNTNKDIKALDQLFHEVGIYQQGKDFGELLQFIKKIPNIAPFNAYLLHIQKPGSQYVASSREWKKRFNRTIKPGARPLVILWPFAPVHFVFELEDTEGNDPFPQEILKPFKTEGSIATDQFDQLMKNLPREGILYSESNYGTGSAGFIEKNRTNKTRAIGKRQVKVLYNLVVNENHTREEKFATITHELGHLFCGHLGKPANNWEYWSDRQKTDKSIREFEAESVSWLICERAGIKNPSAEYLNNYLGENKQVPQISLESVIKATGMIESMMHRTMNIKKVIS